MFLNQSKRSSIRKINNFTDIINALLLKKKHHKPNKEPRAFRIFILVAPGSSYPHTNTYIHTTKAVSYHSLASSLSNSTRILQLEKIRKEKKKNERFDLVAQPRHWSIHTRGTRGTATRTRALAYKLIHYLRINAGGRWKTELNGRGLFPRPDNFPKRENCARPGGGRGRVGDGAGRFW